MSDDESENRWGHAISGWLEGNTAELCSLIKDPNFPMPAFARSFLADLADGKSLRGKGGRPTERDGWVERSIISNVFSEWEKALVMPLDQRIGRPKDIAIAVVAARRDTTEGAIRGIVEKFKKKGITLKEWQSWGRPDWAIK